MKEYWFTHHRCKKEYWCIPYYLGEIEDLLQYISSFLHLGYWTRLLSHASSHSRGEGLSWKYFLYHLSFLGANIHQSWYDEPLRIFHQYNQWYFHRDETVYLFGHDTQVLLVAQQSVLKSIPPWCRKWSVLLYEILSHSFSSFVQQNKRDILCILSSEIHSDSFHFSWVYNLHILDIFFVIIFKMNK